MPEAPVVLLARMRSVSPSSPRLVWYGSDGRIELSGRVFDNWVAKASNLLAEDLDATNGTLVHFGLPAHWKSLALAFACWQVGAIAVLPGPGSDVEADIVLSAEPAPGVEPPRFLVCVALGSLAMSWPGELPADAVDFAAEVRSHGDVYFGTAVDREDAVLVHEGAAHLTAQDLTHGLHLPDAVSSTGDPVTVLLEPGTPLRTALAAALAVWRLDGTLVLLDDGVQVTESLLAGERVTSRPGTG